MEYVMQDGSPGSSVSAKEDGSGYESRAASQIIHLPLSGREMEILRLLARGHTSEEIGKLLRISTSTVNTHRRNMIERCNCRNTIQLVYHACMAGKL